MKMRSAAEMLHNDEVDMREPPYKQARVTCEETLARELKMAELDGIKDGKHGFESMDGIINCDSLPDSLSDCFDSVCEDGKRGDSQPDSLPSSIDEFKLPFQETAPPTIRSPEIRSSRAPS